MYAPIDSLQTYLSQNTTKIHLQQANYLCYTCQCYYRINKPSTYLTANSFTLSLIMLGEILIYKSILFDL
ncbi:MAG: hypothetical protein LBR17_01815 [Bacteroidales bacterium]|nr:hypothetical protein [Bacteroidales bacterium]